MKKLKHHAKAYVGSAEPRGKLFGLVLSKICSSNTSLASIAEIECSKCDAPENELLPTMIVISRQLFRGNHFWISAEPSEYGKVFIRARVQNQNDEVIREGMIELSTSDVTIDDFDSRIEEIIEILTPLKTI